MADYSQYHSLGQGEAIDPNDPNRNTAPAPQQFQQHPIAPSPYQQQQQGYGAPQYGGYQQPMGMPQQQQQPPPPGLGYGAPPQPGMPSPDAGLAAQMGGMSLGDGQTTVRKKKKDRHAHHTVEATGSSQPFHGIPPAGTPETQFLNSPAGPGVPGFGGQFGGGTPQMMQGGQFPSPSNPAYSPANPASPAQFASRFGPADVAATLGTSTAPQQISADDLPSVPTSRDAPQQYFLQNVYPTFERHVPPPASVSYVAFDQGNSSPKYARLTLNNIPASQDGLQATGLPLGMILQPLAPTQAGEAEVPVLDFGEVGPPRCRRCRAYINPFMMFRSGGNKFVCNLCTYPNDTPTEYFCATSPQGVRVDRDQRPELHRGTVEFVVPKEYWTREPVGMRWLFLIDVTQEAFNKGFVEAFCEGVLAALYGGEDEKAEDGAIQRRLPEGAKVGFVTFDKDIHFYNIRVSYARFHCFWTLADLLSLVWSKLR